MKKLLLFAGLFVALTMAQAQNFIPEPGVFYNIKQTISNFVIGPSVSGGISSTQPSVVALTNKKSQAFEFVPVPDKAGTYYLLNGENMYLNMFSTDPGNYWTSIFESSSNALYSEWTIEGDNETGFRLKLGHNSLYLATDGITDGSALYTDKAVDNANGLFKAQVATIDDKPTFISLEKGLVVEVEKEGQPYPIRIFGKDHTYNINVSIPEGFYIEKTAYTPADFIANTGSVKIEIFALESAVIGDTGQVVFSYQRGGETVNIDTMNVTPVPVYERYYMKHKPSNFVVGNHSTSTLYPALTEIIQDYAEGGYTQNIILRKVNPTINDSLYYIVQDASYSMMRKVPSSNWNTEWGYYSPEAVWKIYKREDGIWEVKNNVTKKWLGADAVTIDSRLYDDKTFVLNTTTKPYSEWFFVPVAEMFDQTDSKVSAVTLSGGVLDRAFDPAVTTYNVWAPVDATGITINAKANSLAAFINNNDAVISPDSKTAIISCVAGDNNSKTDYTFNFTELGFNDWDANGETVASRSIASQWGWKGTNATWGGANSTVAGTVRYIDNPAKYYYLGDTLNVGVKLDTVAFKGRILYIRWDGAVTTSGVYSYPVKLSEGKDYTFKAKYAWNSVVPADVTTSTFTFGINSAADNTGTSLVSNTFTAQSDKLMQLEDVTLSFTAPATGIYYLTIANDAAILGAIANLEMEGLNTGLNDGLALNVSAYADGRNVIVRGTQAGDVVKVYNAGGQLINQFKALSDMSTIELQSGVYLIRVNNSVLKIVK